MYSWTIYRTHTYHNYNPAATTNTKREAVTSIRTRSQKIVIDIKIVQLLLYIKTHRIQINTQKRGTLNQYMFRVIFHPENFQLMFV